jgi:hypothetical protein
MATFRSLTWALALWFSLGACTQQPAADTEPEAAPLAATTSVTDPSPDSLKHLVVSPPVGKGMGAFEPLGLQAYGLPLQVMVPAGTQVIPASEAEGGHLLVADEEGFFLEVSLVYLNLEDLAQTWREDERFRRMLTFTYEGMIFSTLREGALDFHMEYVIIGADGQRFRLRSFNEKRPFSRWQANKMYQAARLTQQQLTEPV